jgi:hypothetical protein
MWPAQVLSNSKAAKHYMRSSLPMKKYKNKAHINSDQGLHGPPVLSAILE